MAVVCCINRRRSSCRVTTLALALGVLLMGCHPSTHEEPLSPQHNDNAVGHASMLGPAISWVDDDFMAFNNNGTVTQKYQLLHDYCRSKEIYLDFALVPFNFPATEWLPAKRIETLQQWRDEGFGFLMHPVHEQGGWYNPHDITLVEQAIIDCKAAFALYGLDAPPILVWPGNSYQFRDNMELVTRHYECAIASTYNQINHLAQNDRYVLKRLSFESLGNGTLTKAEFKRRIKQAFDAGDWVILGSHFYNIEVNDVPSATGYTTANVFEILDYAHALCPIEPTASVWNKRKLLWAEQK